MKRRLVAKLGVADLAEQRSSLEWGDDEAIAAWDAFLMEGRT